MECEGLPCRHIFCVLKQERILKFPETLIRKRWTKDVKCDDTTLSRVFLISAKDMKAQQFASLHSYCSRLCQLSSENDEIFAIAKAEIDKITDKVHHIVAGAGVESKNIPPRKRRLSEQVIKDPSLVQTKGEKEGATTKNRTRKCRMCNKSGHTKSNCRMRNIGKQIPDKDKLV